MAWYNNRYKCDNWSIEIKVVSWSYYSHFKDISNYTNIWANFSYVSIFCLTFIFDLVMYFNLPHKSDWICIYEICVEFG